MKALFLATSVLLLGPHVRADRPQPKNLDTLIAALDSPKKDARLQAVQRLGHYGTAGKPAVAALGRVLRDDADDAVAHQAALALARIGSAAVPELVDTLRDGRPGMRERVLEALILLGPDAKAAVPSLIELLSDGNTQVRGLAAHALAEIGPESKDAVPQLCLLLHDRSPAVRSQAGATLCAIGAAAVAAVHETLEKGQVDARLEAVVALRQLAAWHKEAIPSLTGALRDADPNVRTQAAAALGSLGERAKDALPELLLLLKDPQFNPQKQALAAILQIGAKDRPAVLDLISKANEDFVWAAPFILPQFGPKTGDAVKPLIKLLDRKEDGLRLSAVIALGQIGQAAAEAAPSLIRLLQDRNLQVRASAAAALARIQQENDLARKGFMQAIAQVEGQLVLTRKQLGKTALAFPPFGWRPVNWAALTDPGTQSRYRQIVETHVMLSTIKSGAGIEFKQKQALRTATFDLIKQFDAEAVPSIVHGINMAVAYNLGGC